MAANNLRVIYKNLADSANITSTVTPTGVTNIANLKKDTKSLVCRTLGTAVTYTIDLSESAIVGGLILPFCNLSPTAKISVVGSLSGVTKFTETNIFACPYAPLGLWDWGSIPLGSNSYSYGGGTYGRVWISNPASINRLVFTITDINNANGYIELSRIVVGNYWSPTYNTSFGLSTSTKELSEHMRTESGDLTTNRGIKYNTMNFDLKYLTPSDRLAITGILKGNGIYAPLFISLFPNSSDSTKEQAHQIYGKLSQLSGVYHPIFESYSTTIDIEEI